jgi:hypothetical protein
VIQMKTDYYRDNPAVIAAQQAVSQAVEEGRLVRPEACELCGEVPDPILVGKFGGSFYRTSIFAHHWKGYDHPLDVWFICRACDGKLRGPECHNGSISKEEARRIVTNGASDLVTACRALLDYRRRAGALGFQLEKLDDYLRQIENILDSTVGRSHLPRPEEQSR